jgi:hypothetical protein
LLQASIALKTLACDLLHPLPVISVVSNVTCGVPQLSVAVAEPSACSISPDEGLHPSRIVISTGGPKSGGVRSTTQLTVLETLDVFPQASRAMNVRVCERLQPLVKIGPSANVSVGELHASLAVAKPRAWLIGSEGVLQPIFTGE